jgi:hypothetical protein
MLDHMLNFYMAVGNACGTKTGIFPSLYDGLPCTGGNTPSITSLQDIGKIIANVVRILITASGALAVVFLLVAAIYFITSTGDPARVKRAREIIIQTVTGLVVIITAYAFVTFVSGNF